LVQGQAPSDLHEFAEWLIEQGVDIPSMSWNKRHSVARSAASEEGRS